MASAAVIGALDDRKRFRALLGLAHSVMTPTRTSRGAGDGRVRCCSRVRHAGGEMELEGKIDVVEVRFAAPFDGIRRVMDGELHHRHRPADDNVVLAAAGGRLEADHVPVEDLVGGRFARLRGWSRSAI